jgi:hypothetical protein
MLKKLFPILFIFYFTYASMVYAQGQIPVDKSNDQDFEKVLKVQEVYLRKIKEEHQRKERKQHAEDGEEEYRTLQKLRLERSETMQVEGMPVIIDLAQRAVDLYQQTAGLGNDRDTVALRKKLANLAQVLQRLKQEDERTVPGLKVKLSLDQQLSAINQKAYKLNQEVLILANAGDYAGAKKKFNEFEETMRIDLSNLKKYGINKNK